MSKCPYCNGDLGSNWHSAIHEMWEVGGHPPHNPLPDNQEYTDAFTGVRMTIEYDQPHWPRITVFPPDIVGITYDDFKEAVQRLLSSAGLYSPLKEYIK